ncbi:MAG TPA: 16S rRNA (adenine(1518)-N(6)/adenine(1519)-N(6))-dimethyltransferase RsmA [Acidimicrobiales bacterium]|jgi:16S rRNA (adenine1518-N6/adenine1519-N6)-dimethyltransferase|nr:16S rRNA (adenine(1518)-N(6)/adenine(1519)-N(6))-dimethyltransferase RsmA [Acidimicrobiales bacterium]
MALTRRRIAELMSTFDLSPSRALGQNFVADPNTVRRIARLAKVGPGDHVVEVGPGLGSLTLELAATGAEVLAVELDKYVLPALRAVLDEAGVLEPVGLVRVVEADATTAEWHSLLTGAGTWTLVANLPYNVATPLLLDLLDEVPVIGRFLVMVQAEVGERLAAPPGDKAYGIPSVKVAFHATAKVVGRVGPDVFVPRPRVGSALVEIVRRSEPVDVADEALLFSLVRAAFGQRRKMLRRSLAGHVDVTTWDVAGIDPTARPEQLGLEAWVRLADAVAQATASGGS